MINEIGDNPFGLLTFIAAPAILTNASSISALATSNRLARAVDRARKLFTELEQRAGAADQETDLQLQLLQYADTRVALLVRALTAYYVSVGGFAAASLVSLLGAVFFAAHQELLRHVALGAALVAGGLGVIGLVYGSSLLVWETRVTLRSLQDETDFWLERYHRGQSAARPATKGPEPPAASAATST